MTPDDILQGQPVIIADASQINDEIWRAVHGAPFYEVSSTGRFRSLPRQVRCKGGYRHHKGGEIKPFIAKKTGYLQVEVHSKRVNLHRLVAAAFCEGFFEGAVVNHKDGSRTNNSAANLEWVTQSDNNKHAFRVLKRAPTYLGKFSAEHPTSKKVTAFYMSGEVYKHYLSGMDAAREGFDSGAISKCCRGLSSHHKFYRWAYAQ